MVQRSPARREILVDIYESADAVRGHDPNPESSDIKRDPGTAPHKGGDTAWSRCYRVTTAFVVLLCVLLIAVTVLWINYNKLNTENNQLQTNNNKLTKERDQLQTSNNKLTKERDQLQTSYNKLLIKKDQLQTSNNKLTKERDQLQRMTDEFLRTFCDLYKGRCFNYSIYYISTEKKSWTESRSDCKERGADLVIINSTEEQEFIDTLRSGSEAWIGLSDRDREGESTWVDDTTLSIEFSASGEPDSYTENEDCFITGKKSNPVKNWANFPCNHKFMWICEKTVFN